MEWYVSKCIDLLRVLTTSEPVVASEPGNIPVPLLALGAGVGVMLAGLRQQQPQGIGVVLGAT